MDIFSKSVLYKLSSILMARSGFLGQIFLNDIRNSYINWYKSSPMSVETPWYLSAVEDQFEMSCFIYLD